MSKCKSFSYQINNNSRILILGSMPGVKSLELQQYYAHPQNRFWKVMGKLCNCENLQDFDYNEKIKILLRDRFALWDVLDFCERDGSLDTNITNERPNKIQELVKKYPNISKICLNGNKAYNTFQKHFPNLFIEYKCYKLPSTSPANAKFQLKNLIEEWEKIIET